MQYQIIGSQIFAQLGKGDEILESLRALCVKASIHTGTIQGIGTVGKGSIKDYPHQLIGNYDIIALSGNIICQNKSCIADLYITLTDRKHQSISGTLTKGVVNDSLGIIINL